jgi:hypothetical protein
MLSVRTRQTHACQPFRSGSLGRPGKWTNDAGIMWAGSHSAAPGFYFVGYSNPISGNLREIAIDAQRIARHLAPSGVSAQSGWPLLLKPNPGRCERRLQLLAGMVPAPFVLRGVFELFHERLPVEVRFSRA